MYNERLGELRKKLADPLLVSFLPNIRYLTGFTGSNAFLFVTLDRFVFVTDGRYRELGSRLLESIDGSELVVYQSGLEDVLVEQFSDQARVGLESQAVRWSFVQGLESRTDTVLLPTKGIIESLRLVKDQYEVAALTAAARAGDRAFAAVRSLVKEVNTEAELGWALIEEMRHAGGRQAGWPAIVAANANAALPHHLSEDDPVGSELLLLDFGCTVDGYHSDMARTIWLAGEPDAEIAKMYQAVLESQEAGIAKIRPGVTGHEVDASCRAVLAGHGYEDLLLHSTGHGVGLEIHEGPRLAPKSEDVLAAGHVVTVEPGVYVPGLGGIRIEDMILVTESGHQVLTSADKGLEG